MSDVIPTLHEIENGKGNGVVHYYCSPEHRSKETNDYGEVVAIDVPALDVPEGNICEVCAGALRCDESSRDEERRDSDETCNGWKNYETWAVGMYLDGNYDGPGTYYAAIETVRGIMRTDALQASLTLFGIIGLDPLSSADEFYGWFQSLYHLIEQGEFETPDVRVEA